VELGAATSSGEIVGMCRLTSMYIDLHKRLQTNSHMTKRIYSPNKFIKERLKSFFFFFGCPG
jgi:hypothetical protein